MANVRNLEVSGTTDVEEITFNGQEVTKVVYNGTTVWENAPAYGYLTYTTTGNTTDVYTITSETELNKLGASNTFVTEAYDIVLDELTVNSAQVKEFEFTALGAKVFVNNFLAGCTNLTTVIGTEMFTRVGTGFCSGCTSLNCPLTYPGAFAQSGTSASSGTYFLYGCTAFNSTLTIANPNTLHSIGHDFLTNCTSFNQPLTLPTTITEIEYSFMRGCKAFDQPITVPSQVTRLYNDFMRGCSAFNSPLTLSSALTRIDADFMMGCNAYNQPLTLPSSITYIGSGFMWSCLAFTKALTLPSSLTQLQDDFMLNCQAFTGPVSVPAGVTYATDDRGTLAVAQDNLTAPIYATGVSITGAGASEFKSAHPNGYTNPYYRKLI